ncbi:MAG: methyltransferase domain-containing protein [Deltaproteobacteria bacterium]|nr:methyltransferase domain-containing protein [Deltaproteobacteria bacterium]
MRSFRDHYLASSQGRKLVIADLGSYDVNGSYRSLFTQESWRYLGLDVSPGPNVDIVLSDPYRWRELATDAIDVLISGQAFEHIEYFWLTGLEISRVLKPGGLCCLIAPSNGPEHRFPVDCWRFYEDGLRALAAYAGLEVVEAATFREAAGWRDDSGLWQDSWLVARPPGKGWGRRCKEFLYRRCGLLTGPRQV